ncbi:MAG: MFS transporter [Gammaproteobacteria bacterium]|nr:MFS transporter [Gammaproteobacteria bacterium]
MTESPLSEATSTLVRNSPFYARLRRLVDVEPAEVKALLWSFAYFFCLLCSYYIVRPMRDEMGIAGGVENLQWLFAGTFLVMLAAVPLFGWVTSRYPRRQFLPYVYYFFIAQILIFFVLFESDITHAYIARAFFIWASVFNLFIVSVFWSFMADTFGSAQAKRLFGFIAAGGTTGALLGPVLTAGLAIHLGVTNLLLISAMFLGLAVLCVKKLIAWQQTGVAAPNATTNDVQTDEDKAMGGGLFAGLRLVLSSPYLLGICLLMLLFTTLATFLYFQQATIIRDAFVDSAQRTAVFANIDFAVNALTITIQVFLTGRLVRFLGLGLALALIPVLLGAGFLILGFSPVLTVLVVVQVLRRAGNYAIMRPAREMLYTVLGKEEKYKAKNFIDTAVYRGGDAVSAWAYAGLSALGLGLSAIAFVAVPLAGVWAGVAYMLGRKREAMAQQPVALDTLPAKQFA